MVLTGLEVGVGCVWHLAGGGLEAASSSSLQTIGLARFERQGAVLCPSRTAQA